jgi:hypothetical protein
MQKQIIGFVLAAFFLASCNSQTTKEAKPHSDTTRTVQKTGSGPDPRFTVTTKSFGLVQLTDTYEDVLKHYGADRVTEEEMRRAPDADETVKKTIVNKGKTDEIIIQWADDAFHKKILAIEASEPQHIFKSIAGVKYGTTMAELVQLNGAKISFNGFAWDFGGLINNYHGGKLATAEDQPSVLYEITIPDSINGISDGEIMGDVMLDSDMPKVKKYLDKIFVYKITLYPVLKSTQYEKNSIKHFYLRLNSCSGRCTNHHSVQRKRFVACR